MSREIWLHAWSTPCRNAASKEAMIDNTNEASISWPQIGSLYVKTLKSETKLCLLSNAMVFCLYWNFSMNEGVIGRRT